MPMQNQAPGRFCPTCGTPLDATRRGCPRCIPPSISGRGPLLVGAGFLVTFLVLLLLTGHRGPGNLLQERTADAGVRPEAAPSVAAAYGPPAAGTAHSVTAAAGLRRPAPRPARASHPAGTVAPSMLLSGEAPEFRTGGSVLATPARPDVPLAPAVVATPAGPGAGGQAGKVLNGGWLERRGVHENPEIIIHNEAEGTAALVLRDGERSYRYVIGKEGVRATLPPGTYHYELQEEIYLRTGRPDQEGSLTCGRFHTYELSYFHRYGEETQVQHIGD